MRGKLQINRQNLMKYTENTFENDELKALWIFQVWFEIWRLVKG
jgi:hypothetical protein